MYLQPPTNFLFIINVYSYTYLSPAPPADLTLMFNLSSKAQPVWLMMHMFNSAGAFVRMHWPMIRTGSFYLHLVDHPPKKTPHSCKLSPFWRQRLREMRTGDQTERIGHKGVLLISGGVPPLPEKPIAAVQEFDKSGFKSHLKGLMIHDSCKNNLKMSNFCKQVTPRKHLGHNPVLD